MPLYEYRCQTCGEKREAIRPMSESHKDLSEPCSGSAPNIKCVFKRILSPTPTDFRHNDFTGYDGLEKRRSMWDKNL